MPFWASALCCALTLFLVSAELHAATRTSVGSGKWSDAAVWNPNGVPQAGDSVLIATGTDISIDITTPVLKTLKLDGTLHGGHDTIYISDRFFGAGSFQPDSGTVAFYNAGPIVLDGQTVPNYFNLWFGDKKHGSGSRTLMRSLIIQHDLMSDFRATPLAKIDGTGSLTIGGSLIYVGDSTSWSGKIVMNDQKGAKLVRLRIAPPNGAQFTGAFLFPHVTIEKPDTTFIVRFGYADSSLFKNPAVDSLIGDTIYVGTATPFADTAITVLSGTLDAGRGIFSCAGSIRSTATGPFIHIGQGARFRTERVILPGKRAPFDSTISPYFACDRASTFEYYGNGLRGYVDLSYQTSGLVGHEYANLWISNGTVAGFTFDTVHVGGSLFIQFGSLLYPSLTGGPRSEQTIVIHGDVLNQNQGESNSAGAGLDGDGMTAGNETWIFDKPNDTSHWSGPSDLSTVSIGPTTTLAVRFIDDAHCDSLFIVDSLIEQLPPCGGHLVGRVFTNGRLLDSLHQSSAFGGLGLKLSAGSGPYPGLVKIMRTSGYTPPGSFNGNRIAHTIKRYYRITPSNGPQLSSNDTIEFSYHCAEENRIQLSALNFWRSNDNGISWAISGINGRGSAPNSFVLDTNSLGFPNLNNAYLWALSDQEVDEALSVGLESFSLSEHPGGVNLKWSTFAEVKCLGFEITRMSAADTSTIATWTTDPTLRSSSKFGARYQYSDLNAPAGEVAYRLEERNTDGALLRLAVRTLTRTTQADEFQAKLLNDPVAFGEKIRISVEGATEPVEIEAFDIAGRRFFQQSVSTLDRIELPTAPIAGFFSIRLRSGAKLLHLEGVALGH